MRVLLLTTLLLPAAAMAQSTSLRAFEFLGCIGDSNFEPTTVERIETNDSVAFIVQHEATCGLDVGDKPVFSRAGDILTLDYRLSGPDDAVMFCDCVYRAKFTFDTSMRDVRTVAFDGTRVAVLPVVSPRLHEARRLIARIHGFAASRNLPAFDPWMTPDFVSSFGGDGGTKEALARWNAEPELLDTLARITQAPEQCESISDDEIQCPADADVDWRAGFRATPEGWRFAWFVAGD